MRYEHPAECDGGWEGFAVSGTWNSNAKLEATLDQLETKGGYQNYVRRDPPATQRILAYWHELARIGNERKEYCPYPDFFLLTQPSNASKTKAPDEFILVGVHEECMYKTENLVSIARELGFRETKRTSKKLLEELVEEAMQPYDAPCISAQGNLERKGYEVVTP